MKKILLAAAVAGLVAVPTIVSARHGADDTNKATDIRQEDRRQDKAADDKKVVATTVSTTTANDDEDDSQAVAGASTTNTTTVGGIKVENDDDATLPDNAVSLNDAQATAQAEFPSKKITKVEVENEHGSVVYSFRFTDGSRVDVDATTGDVVRIKDKTKNENARQDDNGHHGSGNSGRDHSEDD